MLLQEVDGNCQRIYIFSKIFYEGPREKFDLRKILCSKNISLKENIDIYHIIFFLLIDSIFVNDIIKDI